jgi:hypothetical protein
MHGKGDFIWSDGRKFRGVYRNGKKQGFGVFEWPDGRKYVGLWKDGMQHGRGVFVTKNGMRHEGEWNQGKLNYWILQSNEVNTSQDFGDDTDQGNEV